MFAIISIDYSIKVLNNLKSLNILMHLYRYCSHKRSSYNATDHRTINTSKGHR